MKFIFNFLLGILFGTGLILSNIFQSKTVTTFLNPNVSWDSSLLFIMFGMMLVALLLFLIVKTLKISYLNIFKDTKKRPIDKKLVFGGLLLGIGWSVSGFSVTTAFLDLAFGNWQTVVFITFMVMGFYSPKIYKKITL